jgi:hypothetical protein
MAIPEKITAGASDDSSLDAAALATRLEIGLKILGYCAENVKLVISPSDEYIRSIPVKCVDEGRGLPKSCAAVFQINNPREFCLGLLKPEVSLGEGVGEALTLNGWRVEGYSLAKEKCAVFEDGCVIDLRGRPEFGGYNERVSLTKLTDQILSVVLIGEYGGKGEYQLDLVSGVKKPEEPFPAWLLKPIPR